MNLIWSCIPSPIVHGSFGGYSDRLKGIVTAYLLAKKCGREFGICWQGLTNIRDYFDSPYFADLPEIASVFGWVDHLESDAQLLELIRVIQRDRNNSDILTCNQYDRSHWRLLHGEGTMESTFAGVLNEVLQPNDGIFSHPAYRQLSEQMNGQRVLGLAIRRGDQDWDRPGAFRVPTDSQIIEAMRRFSVDAVLLVSDSPGWKRKFAASINGYVIMLDYETANPDRSAPDRARKAFPLFLIEHFLLSRCSAIITGDGGGGRTAAWWGGRPLVELC